VVQVNGGTGQAGGARGIEPERDIVPTGARGGELSRRIPDQTIEVEILPFLPGHDDVPQIRAVRQDLLQRGQERLADDEDPSPAVVEQCCVIGWLEIGVDRHGDCADLHGTEEAVHQLRGVDHDEQDALLHLDAQIS
jgi:hypothetical protein